jgi:hypothetical protein
MELTPHNRTEAEMLATAYAVIDGLTERVTELEKRLAEEEADHLGTLGQRDQCYEWADKFADAIAAHFREDIGEHSNLNDPWRNAINLIDGTFCR